MYSTFIPEGLLNTNIPKVIRYPKVYPINYKLKNVPAF